MTTDLKVLLEDRPGTLAAACEALGKDGINIEGCFAYVGDSEGLLHLLVEDADAARRALEDAGFLVTSEREVLLVDLEDRPGTAGETLRHIAAAGANLDLVYMATQTRLVVGTDDLERARAAV
jgi:hypothetical protein